MDEFAKSFHQADLVFVLDIYAASEAPIEGVTGRALAERIRDFGHRCVEYTGTIEQTADAVVETARDRDLVLTLGRGQCVAGWRSRSRKAPGGGVVASGSSAKTKKRAAQPATGRSSCATVSLRSRCAWCSAAASTLRNVLSSF